MIDTIKIILKRADTPSGWDINTIAKKLEEATLNIKADGSAYVYGWIGGMKVRVSGDLVTVEGSLPKYLFGNNLQTMKTDDVIAAIDCLRKELNVPLWRGYIKRIDLARNIIVKKKVINYLDSFDETPGYFRDRIKHRLLYKRANSTYSITFYDKVEELKKRDNELYQRNRYGFLNGKNIFRYEVKLEQKINRLLDYPSVRVVHLKSPKFFKKLNEFWRSKYETILTKKSYAFDTNVDGYGGFKKGLLVKAMHDIGINNLFKILEDLRKTGKLTSNQKAYAKQDIKRLMSGSCSLTDFDETIELTQEMDFLYKDVDADVFTHLKNIIVKSEKPFQPQKYPSKYFNGDPIELTKQFKRFYLENAEQFERGCSWELPDSD